MTDEQIVYAFRGSERLITTAISGLCVYLGFRLFSRTLPSSSEITAGKGDLSFKMKHVGPGTLFACFGAAVLIANLMNPLHVQSNSNNPDEKVVSYHQAAGVAVTPDRDKSFRRMQAINQLVSIAASTAPESRAPATTAALNEIESMKWDLLDAIDGDGTTDRYLAIKKNVPGPTPLGKKDADFLKNVEDLIHATF